MANLKIKGQKEIITGGVWKGAEWAAHMADASDKDKKAHATKLKEYDGFPVFDQTAVAGPVHQIKAFGAKTCYVLKPVYRPNGNVLEEIEELADGILLPDHGALIPKVEQIFKNNKGSDNGEPAGFASCAFAGTTKKAGGDHKGNKVYLYTVTEVDVG